MELFTLFGLFLPLIGFFILLLSSQRINRTLTGLIACSTIFLSLICWILCLYLQEVKHLGPLDLTLYDWISLPQIKATFSLRLDSLSLLMALIITGIGFLIHVYSNGYMEEESDYARYFACLNFFIFAMLLLVLAKNLLLLFIGWEGVGLASYLLIGFWYTKLPAAQAATKAFVVNRIGDVGFFLALLLSFYTFGTSDIQEITNKSLEYPIGAPILTIFTCLLFFAATGKSAQLPLYTWLPDAMEGPTPVSALIHAATMVTAGIYLIVRMNEVFSLAPDTLMLIGTVGGITAFFAALCGLAQTDLKRVLAYSTISQLGFMFLACGAGAYFSAMFHLTTHAFIKALLFLSAGNVLHMLHGINDMNKMGGLYKKLPITHGLFLIGALALSGIPPLAAFFSKDLILENEHLAGFHILFYLGLLTSLLTAFYLIRAYSLTFLGKSKSNIKTKEAPQIMLWPIIFLSVLSIFGGFLGFAFDGYPPILVKFLNEVTLSATEKKLMTGTLFTKESFLATAIAIIGCGSALIASIFFRDKISNSWKLLKNGFYVDELYNFIILTPLSYLSKSITYSVEPKIIEGSLDFTTKSISDTAILFQKMQSGQIRSYFAWIIIGAALLTGYFIF